MNAPGEEPRAPREEGRGSGWHALLIALAVGLAYAGSLEAPFVFDDPTPSTPLGHTTRLLVWQSFALNRALSGTETWSYHLFNLGVHLGCALVLLGVLRRALELARPHETRSAREGLALFVSLAWACHPLQTGAVTYLSQRAESLASLAYLGTLYGFLRAQRGTRPWGWLALALACFALGFGAKEIIATAPVVLLLAELALVPGTLRANLRRRAPFHLAMLLVGVLLALRFILPKLFIPGSSSGFGPHESLGPLDYLRTQPGVILHYLRLCVWPHPLVFDYAWPVARATGDWLPQSLALGALLAYGLVRVLRRSALGFALVTFFVLLAPSSSIVPIRDLAFEHRMYLALAVVLLLIALGSRAVLTSAGIARARAAPVLATACVLALAASTAWRNRDYASALALWTTVTRRAPHNPRGHTNLAAALIDAGRTAEARAELQRALELDPASATAHRNLGVIAAGEGRLQEAEAHLRRALASADAAVVRTDLARVLAARGARSEALAELERALELEPECEPAHRERGRLLLEDGRISEAIQELESALRLGPVTAEEERWLGLALAASGRAEEATEHFRAATRLAPDSVEAHEHLARILLERGPSGASEALAEARRAAALAGAPRADVLETLVRAELASGERAAAQKTLATLTALPEARADPELAARLVALRSALQAAD